MRGDTHRGVYFVTDTNAGGRTTKDETEADQRTEDQNIFRNQPCGKEPHVVRSYLFC
jgi:hypothetical protein